MYSFCIFVLAFSNVISLIHGDTIRACENTQLNITCDSPNQYIKISGANYGRTSTSICPKVGNDKNTNCHANNSLEIVKKACQNKTSCSINVNNNDFGEPCLNTYKYLELNYTCELNVSCPQFEVRTCEPFCGPQKEKYCKYPIRPHTNMRCFAIGCSMKCVCQHGFLRDTYTGKCVQENYCPQEGHLSVTNEEYNTCADCQQYCNAFARGTCTCVPGYVCKSGYLRDPYNYKCVLPNYCSTCY